MSTFILNELPSPVAPPACDAAGLTTTYGEALRGSVFGVARERDEVLRYTAIAEALRASVGAGKYDALITAGVPPAGA